jgi:hypothetical protein
MDSTSNYINFSRVQMELGDKPTDYEFLDYATELMRCQRYYEKNEGTNDAIWSGYATNGTSHYNNIYFKVTKRIAPSAGSLSFTNANALNFPATASALNFDSLSMMRAQRIANGTGFGYFSDTWAVDVEL